MGEEGGGANSSQPKNCSRFHATKHLGAVLYQTLDLLIVLIIIVIIIIVCTWYCTKHQMNEKTVFFKKTSPDDH